MKRKNQRLVLLLLAIGAVLGAVLLAMWGLRGNASFFYAPGDIARQGRPPLDRAVRVGGMVRRRDYAAAGRNQRPVLDRRQHAAHILARYTGITPELFREGSGVIADGRFQADGSFAASDILAKHDENYMPPELTERGLHKTDAVR